jgi:eukaryotic-like serine/threonine-protein kinase
VAGSCLGLAFALGASGAHAAAGLYWPMFQGGPEHTGYAPGAVEPPLKVAWRYPATEGAVVSPPVVAAGTVIVETSDAVVGLDSATGVSKWKAGRVAGPVAPVAVDSALPGGLLVFTQGQAKGTAELVAESLSNLPQDGKIGHPRAVPGAPKPWTFSLDDASRGGPTIADGKVFGGTDAGSVYAVDESTGAQVWHTAVGGEVVAPPAVSGGKVFVVAERGKDFVDRLVALDETTGKQVWAYSQTVGIAAATAPTATGGRVFVGLGDGSIRVFRAANGDPVWAQGAGADFRSDSAPAVAGDGVYVSDSAAGMDRFRITDGHREWNYLFEEGLTPAVPLVSSSVVYVGMSDGSVAALDRSTGNLVWRSSTGTGDVGPLAPAGDSLIAQHRGAKGGIVAFSHDPSGTLVDIPSPSRLDLGRALLDFAVALVIVIAGLAIFWVLEARVRRRRGEVTA